MAGWLVGVGGVGVEETGSFNSVKLETVVIF